MRAHFGGYFFGQTGTFMYLVGHAGQVAHFDPAQWPQFSVYNLIVANFWPLYWVAHFIDPLKLDETYWHVYGVAQVQVGGLFTLFQVATAAH